MMTTAARIGSVLAFVAAGLGGWTLYSLNTRRPVSGPPLASAPVPVPVAVEPVAPAVEPPTRRLPPPAAPLPSPIRLESVAPVPPPPPTHIAEVRAALNLSPQEEQRMDEVLGAFRKTARQVVRDHRAGKLTDEDFKAALKQVEADTSEQLETILGHERYEKYAQATQDDGEKLLNAPARAP